MLRKTGFLMLMLFVGIVFLSACQPFALAKIPEDEIPDYIKESIKALGSDDSKAKDIVWRVCEERENYTWVAAEYKLEVSDRTENMYAIAIYDSQGSSGGGITASMPDDTSFAGGVSSPAGHTARTISAQGFTTDKRIVKIVGTTTTGKQVETVPVNGYWCMVLEDPEHNEGWEHVAGVNAKGEIVSKLDLPGLK